MCERARVARVDFLCTLAEVWDAYTDGDGVIPILCMFLLVTRPTITDKSPQQPTHHR